MAEREELKNLLMKAKEDSEKAGLKPNIQKTKIMASGPISSWQIDKQKTAYEMCVGDWSSDVCSSDLYIMRNTGLDEAQASRLPGEISITSDMQMTPRLWQKEKKN